MFTVELDFFFFLSLVIFPDGKDLLIEHPIYTSMLGMLVATGLLVAPWHLLAIAVAFAIAGTEIRVRVEDALLRSRFGETFEQYRRTVPAYVPYVR